MLFNKFFFQLSIHEIPVAAKIQPDKAVEWCSDGDFCVLYYSASRMQYTNALNTNSFHSLTKSSQPINLHISTISSLFSLLAALALHLSGYPRSPTNIILLTHNRSLLSVRLALTLESTSQFSPSTSFQPLCLCPSCSCSYHFFSLCQLTTLTIHNSISLSLPAQDLPLPQIFPPIDSLPASGLTPRTSRLDRFF